MIFKDFFRFFSFIFRKRVITKKAVQLLLVRLHVFKFGGDEENRTPDPLLARQVLSQLSYAPKTDVLMIPKKQAFVKRLLFIFAIIFLPAAAQG